MAILQANSDYYVDTHGVDEPAGGSQADPFKTIAYAVSTVMSLWPGGGGNIHVADGTYDESARGVRVWNSGINGRALYFYGNDAHPDRVVISPGANNSFYVFANYVWISGFSLQSSVRDCLVAEAGSYIDYQNIVFLPTKRFHVRADAFGKARAVGPCRIESGVAQAHLYAKQGNIESIDGGTQTVAGSPNFLTAFAWADFGKINVNPGTPYVGQTSGRKYLVDNNGVIDTNGGGPNFFPGLAAGITQQGGRYR